MEFPFQFPRKKNNTRKGFLPTSGKERLVDKLIGKCQEKKKKWKGKLEFNLFIFIEILQLKDKKKMYFTV